MSPSQNSSGERQTRIDEAIAEYLERVDAGEPWDRETWLSRHNDIRPELLDFLATEAALNATHLVSGSVISSDSDVQSAGTEEHVSASRSAAGTTPNSDRRQIGPYRLLRLLGSGGMGQVFEAVDPAGNPVAVKLLLARWARSQESLQRFRQEGMTAGTISHPRCVFVKTADEDNGQPYIVMELMSGRTLRDLTVQNDRLSVTQAVRAILDVLEGLAEAHSHGLIHRDIKPANCYLEDNGRVKLGDFGLARSMVSESELTQTGDFIGTPLFASPEQVKGQSIDERSDIYSVCATLYFLLTGKAPFAGSSATSVIARIVSEDPQPVREVNRAVPVQLDRIILRGLNRDRNLRFQTAVELRQALEPFVSGRQSIATLGRRFAAYTLDSFPTTLAVGVITLLVDPPNTVVPMPIRFYVMIMMPVVLYFLFWEGWKSASPGKRLLRLHIVDRKTGEAPRRWQLILRSLLSITLLGAGSDLILIALADSGSTQFWLMAQWAGYMCSYLLILSPLLFERSHRMLLHDLLTGTMVTDRPIVSKQRELADRAAVYRIPLLSAAGLPAQFGEFKVSGLICSSAENAVLAARDSQLGRDVWIHLTTRTPGIPSISRRSCSRTTRLRWLTGNRSGNWIWNAYVACQGAPLKVWTAPDSPLSWKTGREVLTQVIEELDQSIRDATNIRVQSLDQIWVDSRGRLTLIDWSLTDGSILNGVDRSAHLVAAPTSGQTPESTVRLNREDCVLLTEVTRLTLCGTSRTLVPNVNLNERSNSSVPGEAGSRKDFETVAVVPAVVPLHARQVLKMFTGRTASESPPETRQLLSVLETNRGKPTEAATEHRFIGLAAATISCSLILGIAASTARIGNQVLMLRTLELLMAPSVVQYLLDPQHDEAYQRAVADSDGFPSKDQLEQLRNKSQELKERLTNEYRLRFSSLDVLSQGIAAGSHLRENSATELGTLQLDWQDSALVVVDWPREGEKERFDFRLLTRLVESDAKLQTVQTLNRPPSLIGLISVTSFLFWILWIGVTKGGLSLRIAGLCVVDSNGNPVSFKLSFARAVLAVIPLILIQLTILWIDLYVLEFVWFSEILFQLLMGLFVVYAVFVIAFPRRAPHDWLLGTHLVPR
ncbi:MAG: protein kinase [Planctomyces sp.]|nr:protein kinase [Planctomyces sp.]